MLAVNNLCLRKWWMLDLIAVILLIRVSFRC